MRITRVADGVFEGTAGRARHGRRAGAPPGLSRRQGQTRIGDQSAQRTQAKTVLTGEGPVRIEVPRDRDGSFKPILIPKHERRFTGFDETIIALYARGMTMR